MKKLGLLAMAFALVMTMSQCKKENTTSTNIEGPKVPITLNVSGGSRVDVATETGVVTFENGDVLHVVSNGTYVGTLSYNGENFAGEVTEPTVGQKLQFYFLGNKNPEFNADNTGCSVVITDQTEQLPVISYAPSRENYQLGLTAYNATLLNQCALVKFDVTTVSEAATCILGMNNKVTVDFTTNEFEYGQDGEGVITLAVGNGERWAILLPQEEVVNTKCMSFDGIYCGVCGTIQPIVENDYLTDGIDITILLPVGAINGLFTINDNGDQVYFSKGNLQYNKTTNEWSFMEHQYDRVETDGQHVGENYANQNIVSLFGWGTSGYNHGANCYQPWSTSSNYRDYWAYGQSYNDLYDGNGQADWGYNAISNGGNMENGGWRTFTVSEWHYIIYSRNTASDIRYAKAVVNNVNGVILLPDNWEASTYALNSTNTYTAYYTSNTISAFDWINILEANGAVFLPAAGERRNSNNDPVVESFDQTGEYWLSSSYSGVSARSLSFTNTSGPTYSLAGASRSYGFSVRLVRNVE